MAIDQPVAAAVVLVNGLTTALANLLFGAETTMYFVPGTVVVAMYGYVLLGLRFAWAAPLVGAIVALNLLTLWALDTPADLMAKAVYMLVISTGILTVGTYRMEMTSRMEHATAEKLLVRERHARETEAARIDWLENLAHFLRHELRNSVACAPRSVCWSGARHPTSATASILGQAKPQPLVFLARAVGFEVDGQVAAAQRFAACTALDRAAVARDSPKRDGVCNPVPYVWGRTKNAGSKGASKHRDVPDGANTPSERDANDRGPR